MRMNGNIIDTHAHLNELDGLHSELAKARRAGIAGIIGVGMDLSSNRRILEIAEEHPGFVFPAIGYHPWEIRTAEIDATLVFLEENIDRCVAIGEVGLDYKARVKKTLQREVFTEIIMLAVRHKKILILHCRYSHQRVFSMISDGAVEKAIFHWYTGSLDFLGSILDAGYFISATPALVYSPPHQEAIRNAPLERILIETDCPVSYQGRKAGPRAIFTSLREVARIKAMPESTIAAVTGKNATALFGLASWGLA